MSQKTFKFSANLGFLFCENNVTLIEKFKLAAAGGFSAVESPFPGKDISHVELLEVKNQLKLEVALVNIDIGDVENGQFGCASFPKMEEQFRKNLQSTVAFAKMFNCKKIHIMGGKLQSAPSQLNFDTYLTNLKYAATVLEKEDILGVIEPINPVSVPGYILNDYKFAVQTLKSVNSKNLKIMVDLFHLQMLAGNITNNLKDFIPYIGHVQIAQTPHRHEPNFPGEVNLLYVLEQLEATRCYDNDYIGCEYKPTTTTLEGLGWVKEFGYSL